MFIDNKYSRWYYSIISNAVSLERLKSNETYYELHHIIPKSLGGSNEKSIEHCIKIKESKADCKWWNDGINTKLCKDFPGEGWIRGRVKN